MERTGDASGGVCQYVCMFDSIAAVCTATGAKRIRTALLAATKHAWRLSHRL